MQKDISEQVSIVKSILAKYREDVGTSSDNESLKNILTDLLIFAHVTPYREHSIEDIFAYAERHFKAETGTQIVITAKIVK